MFDVVAVGIWGCLIAFILASDDLAGVDRIYMAVVRGALESRIVQLAAERSYSTYLLHWPVMMLIAAVLTSALDLHGLSLAAVLVVLAVAGTATLQEVLYRLVEQPARATGKRWARRWGAVSYAEVASEKAVAAELTL
jgi:peptidoglycan/LPS O-acetylase OafA/YrhL